LAWLRAHGYLSWVERGSTPDYRPGVLVSADRAVGEVVGNRQPVYLLTVPDLHRDETRTPSHEVGMCEAHPVRAREDRNPRSSRVFTQVPRTRQERLEAGAELRRRSSSGGQEHRGVAQVLSLHPLRRLTARHVAHICRPFFAADWTPCDVMHAIDHSPTGRPHWHTSVVRSPAYWLRHRLEQWMVEGQPTRSPRQRAEAERAQLLATQRARRTQQEAAREQARPPNEAYRAARAALRARR
jgi:hypothetical protein